MPKITYRQPDGREDTVDVPLGWSLMEAAIQNDIAGIVAECGGGCACATCHVYIDDSSLGAMQPVGDMEGDMLECTAAERRSGSRLSCQLRMTAELEGLVVNIPDEQT
jgi:2Fe-2S ferredoxin